MSGEYEKEALLAALQAHGQQFLSAFGSLPSYPERKRRKLDHGLDGEEASSSQHEEDEWNGFSGEGSLSEDEDTGEQSFGEEVEDDDFRSDLPAGKQPEVIVFNAPGARRGVVESKSQAKMFMSSKVSKIREEVKNVHDKEGGIDAEDFEEERSNLQNDALLHKLVHTQLLSGSLDSELVMTPAQKRKALEGRVLELAGGAKLGKGESLIREGERKKASKRVRLGLEKAVEGRKVRALEQAKNLGNYHQSIKHLFDEASKDKPDRRKRERGLKLGVGKFSGGILKLSKDEIASVQGSRNASWRKNGKGRQRK